MNFELKCLHADTPTPEKIFEKFLREKLEILKMDWSCGALAVQLQTVLKSHFQPIFSVKDYLQLIHSFKLDHKQYLDHCHCKKKENWGGSAMKITLLKKTVYFN